jgi:hypothetical protein
MAITDLPGAFSSSDAADADPGKAVKADGNRNQQQLPFPASQHWLAGVVAL